MEKIFQSCKRGLYKLGQLCIEMGQLEFIRHNMANNIFVEIVCQQPFFEVSPSAKIGKFKNFFSYKSKHVITFL